MARGNAVGNAVGIAMREHAALHSVAVLCSEG